MFYRIKLTKVLVTGLVISFLLVACSPSDSKIAEAVKSKVTAVAPSAMVDVKDGVVTLTGEVADAATKTAAETAIQGTKGVKSIVNNLTLPPPPPPPPIVTINPDDVLRKTIDSAFTAKGIKGITVAVSNGEVTLTGDVKRTDLTKVMQAANESKPKKVINQMKIK
jgi:osmotically-inducible protein OsmY